MTAEHPVPDPTAVPPRASPLAFYGTGSRWKRGLLGLGAVLLAAGVVRSGLEPNGFTNAGLGAIAGYLIGRTTRHFAKVSLLAVAGLLALAAVLGTTGLVPAERVTAWTAGARDWLLGAGDEMRGALLGVAPAGLLTSLGLFAGLGRR